MKNLWYFNLSGFCLTLHATPYTIPYSERESLRLSEPIVLVNGTQKFASLDFREVCEVVANAIKFEKKVCLSTNS